MAQDAFRESLDAYAVCAQRGTLRSMEHSPKDEKTFPEVAPILEAVFPELPRETLRQMHEGFVVLFGELHDEYLREQESEPGTDT